ncbi:MAG: hypothetical protein V1918_01335 [Planctomycetota bacterium]
MRTLLIAVCVTACACVLITPAARAEDSFAKNPVLLGFWGINEADFSAEAPVPIADPAGEGGNDFYYAWPFTFTYNVNLVGLRRTLQENLDAAEKGTDLGQYLRGLIERIDADLASGAKPVDLCITLHADTGQKYYDLADPTTRDRAERSMKARFRTADEIAQENWEPGAVVHGVAIFPAIDPEADAFEIRVSGLGREIMPAYYPGQLMKFALGENGTYPQPTPRLRKALRYFYDRPGDATNRKQDKVRLHSHRSEWIWMWSTEIYPRQSQVFVLNRILRDGDEKRTLTYLYRYFRYEIFNSTADPQEIEVLAAGLAPVIDWHGIRLVAAMEDPSGDFDHRKGQVLRSLRESDPDLVPDTGSRHVKGTILPGRKAAGLSIISLSLRDPQALLQEGIGQLRQLATNASEEEDRDNPLLRAYREIYPRAEESKPLLLQKAPPSDQALRTLILGQADQDLVEKGVEITDQDIVNYRDLVPFAVLIGALANERIEDLDAQGIMPVTFSVFQQGAKDSACFEALFAQAAPSEGVIESQLETTGEFVEPEVMEMELPEALPSTPEFEMPGETTAEGLEAMESTSEAATSATGELTEGELEQLLKEQGKGAENW